MVERPEDLNLPYAVVSRIIKDALPTGISVTKEARSAIAKAASVFVLYSTSSASQITLKNHKKMLNAQDVLSAMEEMEFGGFTDELTKSLEAYRKIQLSKKEQKAKEAKVKAKKSEEKSMEEDTSIQDEPAYDEITLE